jgi:hypothetical protein
MSLRALRVEHARRACCAGKREAVASKQYLQERIVASCGCARECCGVLDRAHASFKSMQQCQVFRT